MKKMSTLPRILILLVALVAIAGFFLPYISMNDAYVEYLESFGEENVAEGVDMKVSDMKNLSLWEYSRLYYLAGEEILGDADTARDNAIGFAMPCAISLLVLVFALFGLATPIILLSPVMAASLYTVNIYIVQIGVMPSDDAVWGISHLLYYVCAALLFALDIWLFAAKKRMKKISKAET